MRMQVAGMALASAFFHRVSITVSIKANKFSSTYHKKICI